MTLLASHSEITNRESGSILSLAQLLKETDIDFQ